LAKGQDQGMEADEVADAPVVDDSELAVVRTVGDLSVVTDADPEPDDGGDVAASRDPDAIAHEIEQTRAELSDTIDAIADRLSPKRAASRGAQAVKAQVSGGRDTAKGGSLGPGSHAASSPLPIGPIVAVTGLVLIIAMFLRRRRSR